MSSSQRYHEVDVAQEQILQERLRILLERLSWSYAALWTLNPQARVLQWKRGYFQLDRRSGTTTSQTMVWNAQRFYATYRTCSFTQGVGYVGRANLEGRHIWLSGHDSVCQNAGSLEQSQFLRCVNIKTMLCIPWLDNVLELGTINFVAENLQLMDQIQQVLSNDLLSVPLEEVISGFGHDTSQAAATPIFKHSAQNTTQLAKLQQQTAAHSTMESSPRSSAMSLQLSEDLNQPRFQSDFDKLSEQVWRSDIFMHEEENELQGPNYSGTESGFGLNSDTTSMGEPDLAGAWMAVRAGDPSIAEVQSASHGLMVSQADHYGSCSFGGTATATTACSVSSRGEYSASPELQQIHALSPPNSLSSAPDRASSSVRQLPQGHHHLEADAAYMKHAPGGGSRDLSHQNLRRTTSCSDQYAIQKSLSLFEGGEMHEQWRQPADLQPNPASEVAFTANTDRHQQSTDLQHRRLSFHRFQHGDEQALPKPMNTGSTNQAALMRNRNMNLIKKVSKIPGPLLRRHTLSALEVLKEVEIYQEAAADQASNLSQEQDVGEQDQSARPADHLEMKTTNLRGRPRVCSSGTGVAPAGADEAAVNHMLAERRRRVKQKENFTTLRSLVPIISKADKASTLEDAIVYLKDLQNTIINLEESKGDIHQRCEVLENKCIKLEQRNKELEALLFKSKSVDSNQLNHLKLHSMKSI